MNRANVEVMLEEPEKSCKIPPSVVQPAHKESHMLAIEDGFIKGYADTVTIFTYDSQEQGLYTTRGGFFDCPTVISDTDRTQTCRVVGFVRWSRGKGWWYLDGFTVFRPNLQIDALNLAAHRQFGIALDSDYFVGSTGSYDSAEDMAREALEKPVGQEL